ncbi:MAG: citrate transporter [Actinobacteria bacterium]|nr:citrate transporter [Actinomycetota bacterium]
MAAVRIVVLVAAIVAALVPGRRVPSWTVVAAIAAAAVAVGIVPTADAGDALGDLSAALAFLALAVPLAVLLDETGFFAALAARFDAGRHLPIALWLLAALTTVVFNLDAAVVLLTPLYVHIAVRHGADPVDLAVIPALLASLASSVLPVSNLTNLVAVERLGASLPDFASNTLVPSAVAVTLGGIIHLRHVRRSWPVRPAPTDGHVDGAPFRVGIPVVVWLVVGFTLGHELSVPPWAVAGAALVALIVVRGHLPWRAVPIGAVAIAAGLGIVAAGAARHLPVDDVLSVRGVPGELATFGVFAVGANAVNNLPALLVGLPALDAHSERLWAVLLGVNLGPTLWVTGALSTLLWQSSMARLGYTVTARTYARYGVRVGVPVLVAVGAVRALQVWIG